MMNLNGSWLTPQRTQSRLVACCKRAAGRDIGVILTLAGLFWGASARAQLDLGALQAQSPSHELLAL